MGVQIPEPVFHIRDHDGSLKAKLRALPKVPKIIERPFTDRIIVSAVPIDRLQQLPPVGEPRTLQYSMPRHISKNLTPKLRAIETRSDSIAQLVCKKSGKPLHSSTFVAEPKKAEEGEAHAVFIDANELTMVIANRREQLWIARFRLGTVFFPWVQVEVETIAHRATLDDLSRTASRFNDVAAAAIQKAEGEKRGVAMYYLPPR